MSLTHFYFVHDGDAATRARQALAKATWTTQFWSELPVNASDLPRVWVEEGRTYPHILDLFDLACSFLSPGDIAIYTNSDICVVSHCAFAIANALQETDAAYCFRRDFAEPFHEPIPDDVVARGSDYPGSDLYAFRVYWWRDHRKDFPDMITGHEAWDPVLRHLMDLTNPGRPTRLRDLIYHHRHPSWWESPANRYRLRGQLHNLRLASAWLKARGIDPAIHGIPASLP